MSADKELGAQRLEFALNFKMKLEAPELLRMVMIVFSVSSNVIILFIETVSSM